MMWSSICSRVLLMFIITSAFVSNPTFANNVCYIEQGGCRYRVTILPTSVCPAASGYGPNNDQPIDGSASSLSTSAATGDEIGSSPSSSSETGSLLSTPGSGHLGNSLDPVKKLETLESKLLKMVEELSVRSLRHIREIRSDLRQMAVSVNSLKTSAGGSRMVTTRSGVAPSGGHAGGGAAGDMVGSQATAGGRLVGGLGMQCPSEFVGLGTWRSCYRFSNFEASWHEAKEYCSAFGANLVSIDTMKEAYIVDYLIKSHPEHQEPKGWWTSGSYVVRSQRWMWTETGQLRPIGAFSRWAPGEPNARSTMHCMILYKPARYHWHDATCSDKHTFICEME